jgi:hypothetical protein
MREALAEIMGIAFASIAEMTVSSLQEFIG